MPPRFHRGDALAYVPDGADLDAALSRTTHLGVGAHPDDLEIMAIEGILHCLENEDAWFGGVIVNDGAGSPRSGRFENFTDEQMVAARIEEQKRAADLGGYASLVMLGHPAGVVKDAKDESTVGDLEVVLRAARPEVVYTHNLTDKHDAHVAVVLRVISAIRRLSADERPGTLYGCEVWRDLDWLVGEDKVVFDTSGHVDLQTRLLEVFESQIAGGKRYDLAALGRRRANATYLEPRQVDAATGAVYGVDLSPLIRDDALDPKDFAGALVEHLATDVSARMDRVG